jgi:hypothetical protein
VEDAGVLFIGVSLLLLPPSLLGYIGALRLNSVLLLIVSIPILTFNEITFSSKSFNF